MHIDENGNAEGNYTLLSFQTILPITNKQSNNYYPLNFALDITANFITNNNKYNNLPFLRFFKKLKWDKIPLDKPVCGFYGENCKNKNGFVFFY